MPNAILQEKVLLVREAYHLAPDGMLLLAFIGTSILLSRFINAVWLPLFLSHPSGFDSSFKRLYVIGVQKIMTPKLLVPAESFSDSCTETVKTPDLHLFEDILKNCVNGQYFQKLLLLKNNRHCKTSLNEPKPVCLKASSRFSDFKTGILLTQNLTPIFFVNPKPEPGFSDSLNRFYLIWKRAFIDPTTSLPVTKPGMNPGLVCFWTEASISISAT